MAEFRISILWPNSILFQGLENWFQNYLLFQYRVGTLIMSTFWKTSGHWIFAACAVVLHTPVSASPVATGGFGGLSPPNWNMKHYKSSFVNFYNVNPPFTNVKHPPLLKSFCRRFWSLLQVSLDVVKRKMSRSNEIMPSAKTSDAAAGGSSAPQML